MGRRYIVTSVECTSPGTPIGFTCLPGHPHYVRKAHLRDHWCRTPGTTIVQNSLWWLRYPSFPIALLAAHPHRHRYAALP
jgi:hypothetical protein